MLRSKLRWRHPPPAAVRPDLVVIDPPICDLGARLLQALEPVFVQALVLELAVEALGVSVLRGFARLVEDVVHALGLRPGHEGPAGELWPVAGSHGVRVKESLIRRVHEARDLPPTIRVEVRARRMGAHPSELEGRGANRFERFRFSEVQCLDEVGPTLRRAFLAEVRDVGLAAALVRYEGTKHYRKLKKALEARASWWEPQGLWVQAIESLKGAGLFPASAFDKPED